MIITKKHIFSLLFLSFLTLLAIFPFAPAIPAQAQDNTLYQSQTGMTDIGAVYGNKTTDIRQIILKVVSIALGLLAVIFLCLTLFAGFKYMTSGGNEEETRKAIKLLTNAVIGLVIIMLSWAITRFIILRLNAAINNNVNAYYPY